MEHFEYHIKSPETLSQAKIQFAGLLDQGLSDESIEVRYHLLGYLLREYAYVGKLPKDATGRPLPVFLKGKYIYWSLSHSQNYTAFSISENPTGIDIVEYQERDISLLDVHGSVEYDVLGGKTWENFYLLWTAKEAIIKAYGDTLDDVHNIKLKKKEENDFSLFEFQGKTYRIKTISQDTMILSLTL